LARTSARTADPVEEFSTTDAVNGTPGFFASSVMMPEEAVAVTAELPALLAALVNWVAILVAIEVALSPAAVMYCSRTPLTVNSTISFAP